MNTKDYLIISWQHEVPAFVSCFKAVPDDKSSYTPNPKTRTAKEIAEHIVGHPLDLIEAIETGVINHRFSTPIKKMSEAAEMFEKDSKILMEKLNKVDSEIWDNRIIKFMFMGSEFEGMNMPLRDISWQMFRDIIHHRGQLSTYFRPMGVRNPVIYGLTREVLDEMMSGQTK